MIVYRISKQHYIEDLSGTGAARYPGRWNSKNTYILYTAATPSLALLESVVHISKIIQDKYSMATIYLPDNMLEEVTVKDLPENWSVFPPPDYLKKYGDDFVRKQKSLALKVPSAIMPEDGNILINPSHPDIKLVKIETIRPITIDSRLL